jgi:hypothetical protein
MVLVCILAAMAKAGVAHAGQDADADDAAQEAPAQPSSLPPPAETGEAEGEAEAAEETDTARGGARPIGFDNPTEPADLLPRIEERDTPMESLFPVAPLGWLREASGRGRQDLFDATSLKVGMTIQQVFQAVTESLPGQDDWGTAATTDLVGSWHLINKGEPTLGQLVAHGQGRWDYGTTGPEELGTFSLGSVIGTADTYAAYTPTFLLRNLYWRQGSREAGWVFQAGKITPDGIVSSSQYLASETTFLPSGGTGPFAIALPDSGLGAAGYFHLSDRIALGALISDANADRFDWGDIDEGDFFTALEFQFQIAPQTPQAGFSKITLWHTDGTSDGQSANGQLGPDGWGFYIKLEQELTRDGRAIGILRYGKSYDDSAVYEEQAAVHFILKEPRILPVFNNDMLGVAFNWADAPIPGARSEYNFEVFYRFPIFPNVDTTFSYQSVIDPALTREFDHASVFSLRFRTTF